MGPREPYTTLTLTLTLASPAPHPKPRVASTFPQASDSLALVSKLEATFTSHATLSTFKQLTEGNTLTHGLPKLRVAFGLPGRSPTWPTLMRHNCPVVIPIRPSVFNRPADWPSRFVATDFIFLRSAQRREGEP